MTQNQDEGSGVPAGKRISRRDFLKVSSAGLAGAVVLGATGCGSGGGSQGSSGGNQKITFSFGREPSGSLNKLIKKFNKQNKGKIQVNWRHMPADTGQYFDQLKTEFQAQQANIDLIGGDVIWPAQFAANGWILDLSDRFSKSEQKKFINGPIESMHYKGKIWGVPWYTDAGMLYYRKDLLKKSGFNEPPKTWDELKTQAKKVMKDSGIQNGFVFQGDNYEGGVVDGLEYIWTDGGEVLGGSSSDKIMIGKPPAVSGLQMERSMVADGVAPQAVATYQEPDCEAVFMGGKAAFCRNWPYMYSTASQYKTKPEQIGVAPLPTGGPNDHTYSGLGGWNFYISALSDSGKQDAAYKFVQFMTAPEQQKFYALNGSYLPTRQALYSDREILNKIPVIKLGKTAIQNTKPRPVSPYYSDMSLKMAEQFNNSLKGATQPKQAAQTLQQELSQIVQQGQG